jgi:hypothetical protein
MPFVHVVLFWLKESTPASIKADLIRDVHENLALIPGCRHASAGRPAMTPRDVVDNTYDVGLCTMFDDRAGHDVYQTHERHLQFVARFKPHFDRIRVYDFQ